MNSFLDMAPVTTRVVVIGGRDYQVPGVKLKAIAYLLKRHWNLIAPLMGRTEDLQNLNNEQMVQGLLSLDDGVFNSIIAAGMGHAGSEKAEAIVARLSGGEQAELMAAIVEESMPAGPGPFVEGVAKLFVAIAKQQQPEVEHRRKGKIRLKASPKR